MRSFLFSFRLNFGCDKERAFVFVNKVICNTLNDLNNIIRIVYSKADVG